uniref:Uncharacterized protein n=1 Tax=Setaria viridis TaxID=4556 RepID=A0A4U6VAB5_SETVI|nr:hypothetical protein SEVIR_4G117302v2 [Setaria viridis]
MCPHHAWWMWRGPHAFRVALEGQYLVRCFDCLVCTVW